MKRLLSLIGIAFIATIVMATNALRDSIGNPVILSPKFGYTDPSYGPGRSPVHSPQVSLDTHVLYFWDACDFTLFIKEEDDEGNEEVVYTTFIPFDETTVNLPAYLSGSYIIEVCRGSQTFVGEIEL